MRISKIELIGFKSFKDRTVIHFDHGITGVVGPNGCGKSNIVDGLLWAMGEMSAKDLRGSTMTDVIFAGSEDYAPSGMAEVSLVLENDGGAFPVQYLKHSEIMVTRRLHRSGESEYLINKEPCRLRDVQEIFMDTGAGSKGFSIIQQGMIGRIIAAKPEERRMLIEEAAGITKFKARKRESQRKLESTDQNLIRLQDIVGELKRQIESLQRQAQRAERYKNLKSQIEDLDVWISSIQYNELNLAAEQAQKLFQEAQAQETESSAELQSLEASIQELRLAVLEQEKEIEQHQLILGESQAAVQKKELEIQELKFNIEQARRSEEMNEALSQEQSARKELLHRDLASLEERHAAIVGVAQKLAEDFQMRSEAFQETQERIQQVDEDLTLSRRDLIALGQTLGALQGQIQGLEGQLSDLRERESHETMVWEELKIKNLEFSQRQAQVVESLEREKALSLEHTENKLRSESNKKELSGKVSEKKTQVEEYKDALNQVASRLYGLENLQSNFEGLSEGVKNIMLWQRAKAQEVHADGSVAFSPISELVEVQPGYELAMEAVLGQKLQLLLTPQTESSLEAIDYLKEKKLGRSGFVLGDAVASPIEADSFSEEVVDEGVLTAMTKVVTAGPEHSLLLKRFLGKILVVDSIRTALRLRSTRPGYSFVTMEGDVLSEEGVLTGGTPDSADSGLMKRKSEIKELILKKEEWAGKLALAQAQLKKLEDEFELALAEFELISTQQREQEIRFAEVKKDIERATTELENSKNICEKQERTCARLATQALELENKIAGMREHDTNLSAQKAAKEEEVEELSNELQEMRLGFDQFQQEVTELQVKSASKSQEKLGLENQMQFLQKNLKDLEDQLQRMGGESQKNSVFLSDGHLQLERARIDFDQMVTQIEERKKLVSLEKNNFEEQSAELRNIENNLSLAHRRLNEAQLKMNESQLKFEQAKMKEQNLIEQVRERYMLDLMAIYQQHMHRDADRASAEKDLVDLRERLSKIGDVNLSAIQEYEESGKRYEFLVQQQADLIDAKDQLRKVIDRINKICSKRFRDTYEMVNERFQKVFPVLFGGGEARLELIEDLEKGDMGIEIIAKPPGKKMQNITLLSGGEKALTAVSLVFSIFLVKPSPYCLLDEVDAPLDDANVFRFNDLVREMAKRSQIIVVTHNKHTMEVASKLYGVTMQEKGVSTMVSVNLKTGTPEDKRD